MKNEMIKEYLQALLNSCAEGYTGAWDSSGEGRDGFMDMGDLIQRVASELKVELEEPDYGEDYE